MHNCSVRAKLRHGNMRMRISVGLVQVSISGPIVNSPLSSSYRSDQTDIGLIHLNLCHLPSKLCVLFLGSENKRGTFFTYVQLIYGRAIHVVHKDQSRANLIIRIKIIMMDFGIGMLVSCLQYMAY